MQLLKINKIYEWVEFYPEKHIHLDNSKKSKHAKEAKE